MARPVLRLATRFTRRTRLTAWGIALACAVLVGSLSLADGLASGVGSVADRIVEGPVLYVDGLELLDSRIDPAVLPSVPGDFTAVRMHVGLLEMNARTFDLVVLALERHANGTVQVPFPAGRDDVSLDTGLRAQIARETGQPPAATGNVTLFGRTFTDMPIAAPPVPRPAIFPDDFAFVRPDLLVAMDPVEGGSVQGILADRAIDPAFAASLGLTRVDVVGAVGFVRGSIEEVQSALRLLSGLVAVVIGLLVYSVMSLEVHQRSREIRTLRSLGASPRIVASVYEGQAAVLALVGGILGSALGIVLAHAVVSFAPLVGLPNLVILSVPLVPVAAALGLAVSVAAVAGLVPSRRVALLVRSREARRS